MLNPPTEIPSMHAPLRQVALRVLTAALLALPIAKPALAAGACPDTLPETMRAIRIAGYGGPDKLTLDTIPVPKPGPGEVLVQVSAASVNPIDWKLREGFAKSWWPLDLPAVLGRDIAGTVVAVGSGAGSWKCGDAVVASLSSSGQGGYAEFVPIGTGDLATKPANLTWREAAAYPLVALTAWQAVVQSGKVKQGERVLVHGGAGGVGAMAVQIAKLQGAHVITTASARNHDYVKSIGADEAIDYKATAFEDVVKDADVVIDTVGGDTLKRSPKVLKRGGRLVSIAGRLPPEECAAVQITCASERLSGSGTLETISGLFAQGRLRINIDAAFPLAKAAEAQELNRAGHTRGKIVLDVRDDAAVGAAAN
jgi:NADPH:quinone reductase-like Zn-dependent oxidoreductase